MSAKQIRCLSKIEANKLIKKSVYEYTNEKAQEQMASEISNSNYYCENNIENNIENHESESDKYEFDLSEGLGKCATQLE